MSANRVCEQLLAATENNSPEDQKTLRQTLFQLMERLLTAREALQAVLEACPETVLEEAWRQAETKRERAARPLTEQLDLALLPAALPEEASPAWVEETGEIYRFTRPVTPNELFQMTREMIERQFLRSDYLDNPQTTKEFLLRHLVHHQQEVFAGIFLDNRNGIQAYEELFFGTIDGCSVHPREVVRRALHHNSAAMIFAHNHPSGNPEPSMADEQITCRLKEALALIDIRVLDHIVIGGNEAVSFAERGLF